MSRLRDANDWRPGDLIIQGPDWVGGFGMCHCCNKPRTWDEYWSWEADSRNIYRRSGKKPVPVLELIRRVRGNVRAVRLKDGGWYYIGPQQKRYILNPACENGGYRTNNKPDPKYATDNQGRFISNGKKSTTAQIHA